MKSDLQEFCLIVFEFVGISAAYLTLFVASAVITFKVLKAILGAP